MTGFTKSGQWTLPLVQPSQSLPTTGLISAEMEVPHRTLSHNSQQLSYYLVFPSEVQTRHLTVLQAIPHLAILFPTA
jgi:hypothetical protein